MRSLLNKFKDRFKDSIYHMVFFMALFSILGYFIPKTYFEFFDKTIYYSIESPVSVGKNTYCSGDPVSIQISRSSLVDTQGFSVKELVLMNGNSGGKEVAKYTTPLAINKGKEVIDIDWILPKSLDDGIYYFRGVVSYEIRGVKKYSSFYTEQFEVKNSETNKQ